jgi:hypothetical protein
MSTTAVVTMVLICGVVWGGFALLLTRALRHEGRKTRDGGGAESSS